jgi:excisionase family DNA binding protein
MDYLISEVLVIKEILLARIEKPEEVPKYLTLKEAIAFLLTNRIPMSKSKLYKLTSSDSIPYFKVGNKLLFSIEELEQWLNNQITKKGISCPSSNLSIIKSAQNKLLK